MKKVAYWTSYRMRIVAASFLMFMSLYMMRTNISVAIVCMVNHTALEEQGLEENSSDVILAPECGRNITVEQQDGEFLWDKTTQSLVLSSFFWGYIVTQIPGGIMAKRLGPRWTFVGFMYVKVRAEPHDHAMQARLARMRSISLCASSAIPTGVAFACYQGLLSTWAPPNERSRMVSYGVAGTHIGNVITLPLGGILCAYVSWDSIFYILGGVGCISCLLWFITVYDSPQEHPRISETERAFIQQSLAGQVHKREKMHTTIPWFDILTSPLVWLMVYTSATYTWGLYTLMTNLPTFMYEVLKYDMAANGFLSALPYVSVFVAQYIAGTLADVMITHEYLSRTWVRKTWTAIALLGSSSFLVAASHVSCERAWLAVLLVTVGNVSSGFCYGGIGVAHADVAPRFSAILVGIFNTAGSASGIVAPYIIGVLTPNHSAAEWQTVFYVNFAIQVSGAILFGAFFSSDLLPWAAVKSDDDDDDDTAPAPTHMSSALVMQSIFPQKCYDNNLSQNGRKQDTESTPEGDRL
ncbi:PREDICTED: sialin-like [Priapulus caudatus]|uniref:Sialin-like n=1 Tax=Priapulus caudatus TaxID=37621 RepID=A0ABM1DT52_PRICU|nr:PREDICTED: sialin-like [Priapulus caudatus]